MNFGASNGYCYCKNFSARICGIGRQHRCIRQGGIIQRGWPLVVVVGLDPRSIYSRGMDPKLTGQVRLTASLNMRDEFASYSFLAVTVAGLVLLCSGLVALVFS